MYFLRVLLELLDCSGEFGRLTAALAGQPPGPPITPTQFRLVLNGQRLDARHKLLALRLYEAPLVVSLGWWAISLPFRLAVYQDETKKLFRRRV